MSAQPRFLIFILILHFLHLITCFHCHAIKIKSTAPLHYPCRPPHHNSHPFCNTSLPFKARAQSLISLLTLDEKIQQLSNNASAVPRLGIPHYEWWSESLHGVADDGPGVSFNGSIKSATSFPQIILAAAAFNRSSWAAVAAAIAVEAKAMNNAGQAGLTFWAPNINIFRDPRWGRGQETPGEDPMVASAYAIQYVRAFEGRNRNKNKNKFDQKRRVLRNDDDDDKLMLSACCKHFTAYDLEKWGQFTRYNFNAVHALITISYKKLELIGISEGDIFKSVFLMKKNSNAKTYAHVLNIITNRYITSDCDAVATIYEYHNYTKTPEDAVAAALKAGTDINCGTYMLRHMKSAIEQEKVLEEDIDKALLNLFVVQIRLGLFDGDSARNQFRELGAQDVCTSDHRKLALEAAKQGIVLLKNEQKLLPLDKRDISSLAVIGPLANSTNLGGGYTGVPCNPKSILKGLQDYINNIYHAAGCQDAPCNSSTYFAEAIAVAKEAEYVVVVAGLDLSQETEDFDRYSLLLPGYQMELVTAVAEVSDKPLILVLTGGGPIDVSFAVGDPSIGSIVWIGYPGETGGRALAEIIFGDYNPGGRLPMTWYPESFTTVPMSDMNMRPDPSRNYPGRTYRFYTGDRIYGFGHGLSYTTFTYTLLSAPNTLKIPESIKPRQLRNTLYNIGNRHNYIYIDEIPYCSSLTFEVQISVTNNGDIDGSEVVLLFSKASKKFKGSPEKQLIGFERVNVLSYGSGESRFLVDPCEHLSFADEHGNRILPIGDHILISENIEHVVSIET
ncbi:hypothetical protein BUALT_Bualt04G0092700 [Buddleja alternifolia]|uniref:Fibronectin type III-like domain-containing protein n=1 Tax=Buddleja alternifolia TaxID=168488 RepID=A0AAV6XMK6_9LAMI|nr:hypothetical protein BUALT_Bualt04G0092700 [Buddleja alternifolia]